MAGLFINEFENDQTCGNQKLDAREYGEWHNGIQNRVQHPHGQPNKQNQCINDGNIFRRFCSVRFYDLREQRNRNQRPSQVTQKLNIHSLVTKDLLDNWFQFLMGLSISASKNSI